MTDKVKKALIGALISLALAFAVSYGLISQDTADKVQTRVNETLSEDNAGAAPGSQNPGEPSPSRDGAAPQNAEPDSKPAQRE